MWWWPFYLVTKALVITSSQLSQLSEGNFVLKPFSLWRLWRCNNGFVVCWVCFEFCNNFFPILLGDFESFLQFAQHSHHCNVACNLLCIFIWLGSWNESCCTEWIWNFFCFIKRTKAARQNWIVNLELNWN